MSDKTIFVYIALGAENFLVGRLWSYNRKGRQSASFQYDGTWLKHPERFALEPALTLTGGSFHTPAEQYIFGSIGDSAPDRWGRALMRRIENQRAKNVKETSRTLSEMDYLLGVNDEARQGALRFSETLGGKFLSYKAQKIPPLVDLQRLLSATDRYLKDEETNQDLKLLLAPGSSLGGARPKASIRDRNGDLAIAKFSRHDDEFSNVAWEAVALTLAKNAGIQVSEWRLETVLEKPVLILQRFDRLNQERLPFLSAMSMLGAKDNEQHSYLEMADALMQHGGSPDADLAELWRRIVFNILISNTDDHLRNHGFLYERQLGWKLSPAYDMNPTPIEIKPRILTTCINEDDNTASLEVAFSIASYFRLSDEKARAIVKEVGQGVSHWREVAKNFGIGDKEIERMASAFEHEDLRMAQEFDDT